MNGIIVINIDDDLHPSSSSSLSMCRICHEQEEYYESLEAPCSCSGTVKFAHRDCVQRWCDEKGDTTCELCMQKFEPGYTCPPPIKAQSTVTIRASLEVPRNDPAEQGIFISSVEYDDASEEEADDSTSAASSVALVLTALLLVRHLFAVVSGEAETYPFSLLTVLIAKASGILVPMYILTRIVAALRKSITRHRHNNQNFDERQ